MQESTGVQFKYSLFHLRPSKQAFIYNKDLLWKIFLDNFSVRPFSFFQYIYMGLPIYNEILNKYRKNTNSAKKRQFFSRFWKKAYLNVYMKNCMLKLNKCATLNGVARTFANLQTYILTNIGITLFVLVIDDHCCQSPQKSIVP